MHGEAPALAAMSRRGGAGGHLNATRRMQGCRAVQQRGLDMHHLSDAAAASVNIMKRWRVRTKARTRACRSRPPRRGRVRLRSAASRLQHDVERPVSGVRATRAAVPFHSTQSAQRKRSRLRHAQQPGARKQSPATPRGKVSARLGGAHTHRKEVCAELMTWAEFWLLQVPRMNE